MLSAKQEVASVLAMPMISVPEFSRGMGVSIDTSRRWLKEGTLRGYRQVVSGGKSRFPKWTE